MPFPSCHPFFSFSFYLLKLFFQSSLWLNKVWEEANILLAFNEILNQLRTNWRNYKQDIQRNICMRLSRLWLRLGISGTRSLRSSLTVIRDPRSQQTDERVVIAATADRVLYIWSQMNLLFICSADFAILFKNMSQGMSETSGRDY